MMAKHKISTGGVLVDALDRLGGRVIPAAPTLPAASMAAG
jgi:hypothetical protein